MHLRNLFVAREHWGGGLASAMHAAAVGAAAQRGHTAMRLFVATGQERARRFYAREGWADVGAPFFDPAARPRAESSSAGPSAERGGERVEVGARPGAPGRAEARVLA